MPVIFNYIVRQLAALVSGLCLALSAIAAPETSVFDGTIVSPESADITKLDFHPKAPVVQPTDAELKKRVVGRWKSQTSELLLTSDGQFVFTEKHPDRSETITGTWEIKAGKILYSITPKTTSAPQEAYHHTVLKTGASSLQLQTPNGLTFDFIKVSEQKTEPTR